MTAPGVSTFTALVAISKLPVGAEYTCAKLRDALVAMGVNLDSATGTAAGNASVISNLTHTAVRRGLLVKTRKTAPEPRPDRPSFRDVPVYVRTDVTRVHAPPGRVEEAEKLLGTVAP